MTQPPSSGHDFDHTDEIPISSGDLSLNGETRLSVPDDGSKSDGTADGKIADGKSAADKRTVVPTGSDHETTMGAGSPSQKPTWVDVEYDTIGRFRVVRVLGRGGFGTVLLAEDDDLKRLVSIKVPRRTDVNSDIDVERYMSEAQTVAQLDHPHIVPVYNVGLLPDGLCYVVSKYIDGASLADQMKARRFSVEEIIDIVSTLAETLQFVHSKSIVHRDIKPANILRDNNGHIFLADFGLAVQDTDFVASGNAVGTPAYMSPEQARGEGHLTDGRSDIFSLGIVLYQMLTGVRPFVGGTPIETIKQILNHSPRPIRQINSQLPRELELICQKALSKRASDRYDAAGIVEDLKACKRNDYTSVSVAIDTEAVAPESDSMRSEEGSQVAVIPKGLRSYEAHDAYFFRELLAGPYDIDECPESIRFWKNRIDPNGQADPFRVGVIYGTSGCGKSSFIRAGLSPLIDEWVLVSMINASPGRTIQSLETALRKQLPAFETDQPVSHRLSTIRRADNWPKGQKLLIVIDQFEQWLDSATADEREEMVRALRQCDGERIQTILLVRDDFWLALSRLMGELDIEMVPGQNLALIDLFDKPHARRVLTLLGRAYGRVTDDDLATSREQKLFIADAVDAIADNDRVVPVRLALFAEMVKSQKWTRTTLRSLGGIDGIGERFLYESFDAPTATRELSIHQQAAHATLQAMLPEAGVIRGSTLSRSELLQASGYANQPEHFDQLMQILDGNLRLITAVESETLDTVAPDDSSSGAMAESRYQLTHDFLVPSVRKWVTRHQRSTRRGRAELALAERANSWAANPTHRELPSFSEWLQFQFLTRRAGRPETANRMMQQAGKRYGLISFSVAATLCVAIAGWFVIREQMRGAALVDQLGTAATSDVPGIVEQLSRNSWSPAVLSSLRDDPTATDRQRFRAIMAGNEQDSQSKEFMRTYLLKADVKTLKLALELQGDNLAYLSEPLQSDLEDESLEDRNRLNAALLLGNLIDCESDDGDSNGGDPREGDCWGQQAAFVTDGLVRESLSNRIVYPDLVDLARPLRARLAATLISLANNYEEANQQQTAVTLLRDLYFDDPVELTDYFLDLSPIEVDSVLPLLKEQRNAIMPLLEQAVSETSDSTDIAARDNRRANAAALLASFGRYSKIWPALDFDPSATVQPRLIHTLPMFGAACDPIVEHYPKAEHASLRHALLLAMGELYLNNPFADLKDRIRAIARDAFENDPDSGVHGAAEWVLSNLDDKPWLAKAKARLAVRVAEPTNKEGSPNWTITPRGMTFVTIDARNERDIGYQFQVSTGEITVGEFREFWPDYSDFGEVPHDSEDGPMSVVSWFGAVKYCRWLTEQEGFGEEDQCYPADSEEEIISLHNAYKSRRGYRLLTSNEWKIAHRGGLSIPPYENMPLFIIGKYAAVRDSSGNMPLYLGRLKPNNAGAFNLSANVSEWLSDRDSHQRAVTHCSFNSNLKAIENMEFIGFAVPETPYRSWGFRIGRSIPE